MSREGSSDANNRYPMLIPYSTVSKVLRRKDHHLARDVSPKPPRFDRPQSKASKHIEQGLQNLDESAPWSSWSKITAAGRNAMMIPAPPTSCRRPMQANQTSKVEYNLFSMQMGSAPMRDVSQMPALPAFNLSQEPSPTLEKDFLDRASTKPSVIICAVLRIQ